MSILDATNKPKNILELLSFDLTKFFADNDYCEIQSKDIEGVFMVEFEKEFPLVELGMFEKVVFRLFNDKNNINGSNHINVTMPANQRYVTSSRVKSLINSLYNVYGYDDDRKGEWDDADLSAFAEKDLERQWTVGNDKCVYAVKLSYTEKRGLILKIFFFNRLMESLNREDEQSYY
ncbi:MAG: hypothetical protein IJ911_05870 [Salinivirgaceae bacterium]|nr:hypothetical protein [Salinivirgaceae bacterium]